MGSEGLKPSYNPSKFSTKKKRKGFEKLMSLLPVTLLAQNQAWTIKEFQSNYSPSSLLAREIKGEDFKKFKAQNEKFKEEDFYSSSSFITNSKRIA